MRILQIFCCMAVLCSLLFAQPRSYPATRTASPPVIDGFGNDAVWQQAAVGSGFVQREPVDNAPETERTEFRILFDDDNIYLTAMMYDANPDSIASRLARRDNVPQSDWFAVAFDSYYDRQTAFIFVVLPSGSKTDLLEYNDGRDEDESWDPVWETATRILENGWSVEMRIPLSQIRFTEGNDTWGVNVIRKIARKQEETNWSLISKHKDGYVSQFGTMTGMADIKSANAAEVLPYAVGSSEHYPRTDERVKIERLRPDAGVDLKYGVTSNFTLDATINPDFAQVEADPAVLNLSSFETFYPEKRPFFIEGTQILRFVTFGGDFGPGLFYSRRIGRPISVGAPEPGALITDEPRSATILGAAKFSGKTEGGTSIGVLTALTDEEEFSFRDTLGRERSLRAEPSASYNLFRIKQDFWGNSNIGAIVTGTSRTGAVPAYTVGTDWDVKLDSSTYRVYGFLAVSHANTFINKHFQTLRQPYLQQGSAGKLNFAKVSGAWTYGAGFDFTSKKYYINDIGFFRSPNDYGVGVNGGYRNYTPGDYFRSYTFNGNIHWRWNYDRMTLFREFNLSSSAQFVNYWSLSGSTSYSLGGQDPYEPRGYGVYNIPASFFIRGEIESDNRKDIIVEAEQNYRRYADGGTISNTEGVVTLRPTTAMEYKVSMGYERQRDLDRYVRRYTDTLIAFAAADPVPLFGSRDVDGVDLTLRSSILFTSDLSLQIYNQFYWEQRQFDTTTYALLDPARNLVPYAYGREEEVNRTSLQTNVVLRWEYREGSTFYFVWSHGRSFFERGGYETGFGTNLGNTFRRTAPDNVFAVKVSYWMNL
ncbi:MAG: carbohydrate binding family 9 domain-containing protein [Bacteroidetes bacterium]|nr:carbohydrate binding family 9 domain-containing protein [Bacteroidota bacterium]